MTLLKIYYFVLTITLMFMATHPKLSSQTINELYLPRLVNILMLLVWITAAVGIVLPFALGTSPLDALLLRVPNNEGNWWHALVGLPFFLSLPMIWLLFSKSYAKTYK